MDATKASLLPTQQSTASRVAIYELTLQSDGHPTESKSYVRLPPPNEPYVLRLKLERGGEASERDGTLWTNYPAEGKTFKRDLFYDTLLPQDYSTPFQVDIHISKPGVFTYYLTYSSFESATKTTPGYFIVDPVLRIPARTPILTPDLSASAPNPSSSKTSDNASEGGRVTSELISLPLDGLVIQTIIGKWIGSFLPLTGSKTSEWEAQMRLISSRGYNMLHYTPLQKRGASGSCYSIENQLEWDDDLFDTSLGGGEGRSLKSEEKDKVVGEWLKRIKEKFGMLGMMDVVLNHTANNSDWLLDHPEAGYNVSNSPHLESALILDRTISLFSQNLANGSLPRATSMPNRTISPDIKNEADLETIMRYFEHEVLAPLKLWEFYGIDIEAVETEFTKEWAKGSNPEESKTDSPLQGEALLHAFITLCFSPDYTHLSSRHALRPLSIQSCISFLFSHSPSLSPASSSNLKEAWHILKSLLDGVNLLRYKTWDEDREAILSNTRGRARFTRLEEGGPKMGRVTSENPLVESLFTHLPSNSRTSKHDPKSLSLANNGWIWDADPLVDFASPSSSTYLRRDLIVWSDCVKLYYGPSPSSSPFLWKHMTSYVRKLASLFEGFRLDNCHSTPLHVGEYMLDQARSVREDLYVCAELFTGSQEMDVVFVKRLGLNSLIREAMNANDPKEQSGLLYNFGLGKPIGAMDTDCLTSLTTIALPSGKTCAARIIPLAGSTPHAFLMDITHDNESALSKRTAEDALSTGALVTFAKAAIGSNRGFDDLYPKLLDVVKENRRYEVPEKEEGIAGVKRLLNHLHTECVLGEFVEGHFSQDGEYITSHRVNPVTHRGYLLVAHTAFPGSTGRGTVAPIRLDGQIVKFITGATLSISSHESRDSSTTLRGLPASLIPIEPILPRIKSDAQGSYSEIVVPDVFPPGSVLVFATEMDGLGSELDEICSSGAEEAFKGLGLVDLNVLVYRADGEERDAVGGDGTYTVPDYGSLVYCGLQGWMALLKPIMEKNDLGHPLCAHLRNGTWALDYVHNRLEKQIDRHPKLAPAAAWFHKRFELIKSSIPPFLRPKYFAMVTNVAYKAAVTRIIEQYSTLIREGPDFTKELALTSVQMYGMVKSASLDSKKETPSLAAGLPHFTAGWARTWGRDVFISLRGLFLVTGQFEAAREHILAFASVLKHGLIPNLLDSGRTPRYNSRDSPWFMLQNIQDFVNMAPNGLDLLNDTVKRRFPLSDEWVPFDDAKAYATKSSISEIIQEVLQRHASGIKFREYNAGPNLDGQMKDEGFNVEIEVDWKTGFIYGGNQSNCGTWMDKMGESEKAGNKGMPGTPRDGAPVEIVGLLKSAVRWLADLSKKGLFPHQGVKATVEGVDRLVTYAEWSDLIQASFERSYYVPLDPAEDKDYQIDGKLVARRGIYKDVIGTGAGRERADYQLRCNFPIAMAVAPELFDATHALKALVIYQRVLVGPLGVKTLDPEDSDYRGSYDNSNDSHDRSVAKGWNYHQGPEWVWPIGYFLRAYLTFDTQVGAGKIDKHHTYHHIHRTLATHRSHISSDKWAGLPELTNEGGAECYDSCRTQAWSSSTILDVLDDMDRMQEL